MIFDADITQDLVGNVIGLDFKFECVGQHTLYPILNKPNGLFGYLNTYTQEITIDFQFEYADEFNFSYRGLAPVKKNGLWGYIGKDESIQIDFQFEHAGKFSLSKKAFVTLRQGQQGVIDTKGNYLIRPSDFFIERVERDHGHIEDYYAFFNKWYQRQDNGGRHYIQGLIASDGKVLLQPEFNYLYVSYDYEKYFYEVRGENSYSKEIDYRTDSNYRVVKYGLYDRNWKQILPIKYDQIFYTQLPHPYTNKDVIIVRTQGQYQVLNMQGQFITSIKFPYESVYQLGSFLYGFEKDGKYGVLDWKMNEILPAKYDYIELKGKLLKVDSLEKSAYFNLSGKRLLPFDYSSEWRDEPYFDFIVAKKNDKYGLINMKGEEVTNFEYDEIISNFKEGPHTNGNNYASSYGPIKKEKKFGLINKNGELITNFIFDFAEGFLYSNNFSVVKQNGLFGIVNNEGRKLLFSKKFDEAEALPMGIVRAKLGGKYFYYDKSLRCIYGCMK